MFIPILKYLLHKFKGDISYMSCIFDNLIETWQGDRRSEKSRYLKTQVTDVKSRFSKRIKT